jgi:hypothetical protein
MPDAYQTFCELWASLEYQEKSVKKRKTGELTGTHAFGAKWIRLYGSTSGKSSYIIFFHYHIYNDMLLIATCRKL